MAMNLSMASICLVTNLRGDCMGHIEAIYVIRRKFAYLFQEYKFDIIFERYFDSFGNWVIVLVSRDCRVRFFQDRGEITISIGPLWSPPGWEAGPWFDLFLVLEYLTKRTSVWGYQPGSMSQQLDYLSATLRPYCSQLYELFNPDSFSATEAELRLLKEKRDKEFWNKITS